MQSEPTLLFRQSDVKELLTLGQCIEAVERVFRLQGQDKLPPTGILSMKGLDRGSLHLKTALLQGDRTYVAAKLNTNFPGNQVRFGLPTIQGLIVLYDGENGRPLAVFDSIEITIKRTAAATAVAAKYLARTNSSIATICGCGQQGRAQVRALTSVLPLTRVDAFDRVETAAVNFATELSRELKIDIQPVQDLSGPIRKSDVCVTCTTASKFFVHKNDVASGSFIAAVGADDVHKQEIDPQLMVTAKVIADCLEQCCAIGDTHHAIVQGLMRKEMFTANWAK